jgi:hypothetical protein
MDRFPRVHREGVGAFRRRVGTLLLQVPEPSSSDGGVPDAP